MINEYLSKDKYFKKQSFLNTIDYEENYWGEVIDPDGKKRNRLEEREQYLEDIKKELEYLGNLTCGKIIDVGCGLGFLLSALDPKWEKHGVEVSKLAAEQAKKWGKIFVGNLNKANHPSEYFDVVVLYHVIEHIDNPFDIINEIKRILKPKGKLILGTPDFDCACARLFKDKFRLLHDKTHVSLFTNDSMHRFLRDNSFIIEKVEYPFFETRHFTKDNILRLLDTSKISPPFYGNVMNFYAHKA